MWWSSSGGRVPDPTTVRAYEDTTELALEIFGGWCPTLAASRPRHKWIALRLAVCTYFRVNKSAKADGKTHFVCFERVRDLEAPFLVRDTRVQRIKTNLYQNVRRVMAAVRRVQIARETGGLAIGTDVDFVADSAMESCANDVEHTTAKVRSDQSMRTCTMLLTGHIGPRGGLRLNRNDILGIHG
jgi:hypothetical protein